MLIRAITTSLLLATPALAQSNNEGPNSVTETFQDWIVQCADGSSENSAARTCQMSQSLSRSSDGRQVLSVAVQTNTEGEPVLRLVTPLGVALSQGVGIEMLEQELVRFGYQTCLPAGCVAQGLLETSHLEALRAGAEAEVTMLGISGEDVSLTVSLMGFTAAWQRLSELSS